MSFQNVKIQAVGADPREYHQPGAQRGTKEFVVSSSSLREVFARCPAAWLGGWALPESEALNYGALFDCLALTPDQFKRRYAVQPETYMADGAKKNDPPQSKPWNNNATVCREWKAEQNKVGREIVTPSDLSEANKAVMRLYADPNIKAFLDGSDKQVWVVGEWHDEPTGLVVPVQCLIDLVELEVPMTRQRIGDLKTTKNAAPGAWARWARFAGYDVQAAWNLDLYNAASGRGLELFEFVLSESDFPYQTARRVAIDPNSGSPEGDEGSAIVSGRRQYRRMLADYCQCLKHNRWPGYDDTDAGSNGATELRSDPYEEQRRMFAPRYSFGSEPEAEEEYIDLIP